jgi:hypothetical protein
MRHLFNRGFYKPSRVSGEEMRRAMLILRPEIYGSVNDPQKVELEGLVYVMDRLPKGIEGCRFITLASREGYENSRFPVQIPAKRRRNCYQIDGEQMVIEVTNGRSEIYDIMTHLTFMFMEADKIRQHAFHERGGVTREWEKLEEIILSGGTVEEDERELALTYVSTILGRTFGETEKAYHRFRENAAANSGLFEIVYKLGKVSMMEKDKQLDREISFTPTLREHIGHHFYGERWANHIKQYLVEKQLHERPLHIISANPHSVLNCLFAPAVLSENHPEDTIYDMALQLSRGENEGLRKKVLKYACDNGLHQLEDISGTSILVQLIDTSRIDLKKLHPQLVYDKDYVRKQKPVILVMDYAFGEQAFETMDELLKPYDHRSRGFEMNVASISIMGKAGILTGEKGDLMIPTSHIFEGTADNYPLKNEFTAEEFAKDGINVFEGSMITVLGTSLQNRDILSYFRNSSWKAVGLEMEGAHYQKAIQSQAMIRGSIRKDVKVRYAYYASDNPLITGATLASGSLGTVGVKPTYVITLKCLGRILSQAEVAEPVETK